MGLCWKGEGGGYDYGSSGKGEAEDGVGSGERGGLALEEGWWKGTLRDLSGSEGCRVESRYIFQLSRD